MPQPTVPEFLASIGVNLHLDFRDTPYEDVTQVVKDLKYLGVKWYRDCLQRPAKLAAWQQVYQGTGGKFISYINSGGPDDWNLCYELWDSLYKAGMVHIYESCNEPDKPYSIDRGATFPLAVKYQKEVLWPWAKVHAKPLVNMSFGAGWTAADGWKGNYDAVGDLSLWCSYGNAHTYPNPDQPMTVTTERLNGLAAMAAKTRPVMTTEVGVALGNHVSEAKQASDLIEGLFAGFLLGNTKTMIYGLYDDQSGNWGLLGANGKLRHSGAAVARLTQLLGPKGTGGLLLDDFQAEATTSSLTAPYVLKLRGYGCGWVVIWTTGPTQEVTIKAKGKQLQIYSATDGLALPVSKSQVQLLATAAVVLVQVREP